MANIFLNPVVRRQDFTLSPNENSFNLELKGSFKLPSKQRALIGIDKHELSACPKGFTESPGGFYYFYLWGSGESERIAQTVDLQNEIKRTLPMFVRLWESDGPFELELEGARLPDQVAIMGGCCSRDAFELESNVDVSEYRARTSFASLASPGVAYLSDDVFERIDSAFQRRMVRGDILKESLRSVILAAGNHVIVDFMIERTPIFFAGESIVTKSPEFKKLSLSSHELPGSIRNIERDSEEYFELFETGWKYATQQIAAAGKRILVNEIFWATHNDLGEPFEISTVENENRRLERLYNIVETVTPEVEWIRYDAELFVADSDHRWGQSPFHFTKAFYEAQIDQIEQIVSGDR